MKAAIRSTLTRLGVSHRFNDTPLYAAYVRLIYPLESRTRREQFQFFQHLLEGSRLVFDIGANEGNKTLLFSRVADRVISVEPNPACVAILRKRFRNNPRVTIIPQGVSDSAGTGTLFACSGDQSGYSSFSREWADDHGRPAFTAGVALTTVDDLIRRFGAPSYIKIDVEGYEAHVLRGLRTPVSLLSFEANLPVFLRETLECLTLLERLSGGSRFNYCPSEPVRGFALDRWVTADEIRRIATQPGLTFMEVFCATDHPLKT